MPHGRQTPAVQVRSGPLHCMAVAQHACPAEPQVVPASAGTQDVPALHVVPASHTLQALPDDPHALPASPPLHVPPAQQPPLHGWVASQLATHAFETHASSGGHCVAPRHSTHVPFWQ
jgi:hypothetical protein